MPFKKKNRMTNLIGSVVGEMSPDDIPVNKDINIEELKGKEDPLEIIVEIPASKSKRGWNYKEKSITDIVDVVNNKTLNGFQGHQKAEDVSTEFPDIATHWVGAKWDAENKKGYFRGIIDPSAKKLKNWIKNKRIKNVSIFGVPELEKDKQGNVNVVGYKPYSIDWTPLDRAGMETKILYSGEMDSNIDIFGELDGSYEEIRDALQKAVYTYFKVSDEEDNYIYIRKTFQDYAIVNVENKDGVKLYQVDFKENDNDIQITKSQEVKLIEKYVPVEAENDDEGTGEESEMALSKEHEQIIGEMSAEDLKKSLELANKYEEMKKNEAERLKGEMINQLLAEKIGNENLKNFILENYTFKSDEKEKLSGEIDELLNKDSIKNIISSMGGNNINPVNHKGNNNNNSYVGVKVKKVSLGG